MAAIKWKNAPGKTWREKLHREHPSHGKIVRIPPGMQARFGRGTMVIPKPADVDALMRKARKGRLLTAGLIREALAKQCGADHACPLTTGIFMRIAAEAAEEDREQGRKRITPYWRTIKDDGTLNEKFPGGAEAQARFLRKEGFAIESNRTGSKLRVKDFARHLASLA